MIDLYFEILTKPRAEITMIDQFIVSIPIIILVVIFLILGWLNERKG